MQKIEKWLCLFLVLVIFPPAAAQNFSLKLHYGYYYPSLGDVNSKIEEDIRGLRRDLQAPVPSPGEFNGSGVLGGQLEYRLNEDYFINLNVSYFQEKVELQYRPSPAPSWRLEYLRELKSIDAIINLHFYFNYSTWKRFNKYLGIGVGLMFLQAESFTGSDNPDELLETRGKFSGNILSGVLAVGGHYRLSKPLLFWGEIGLQYGNFGELDGTVTTLENPNEVETVSNSSFDLTGLYARAGLGIGLPFLK